jgi:hypothetical protein
MTSLILLGSLTYIQFLKLVVTEHFYNQKYSYLPLTIHSYFSAKHLFSCMVYYYNCKFSIRSATYYSFNDFLMHPKVVYSQLFFNSYLMIAQYSQRHVK